MKINEALRKILNTKAALFVFLILVWAAVGLVSGFVLGRLIWMIQMH